MGTPKLEKYCSRQRLCKGPAVGRARVLSSGEELGAAVTEMWLKVARVRQEGKIEFKQHWVLSDPLRTRRELRLYLVLPRPTRLIDPQAAMSAKTF